MNFKIKAGLQKIFSHLPYGERINYAFQRFVTKGLPLPQEKFIQKVNDIALKHRRNFTEFNAVSVNTMRYYEFGAGWDLITPLTMALSGFAVTCIDIRKLIIPSLINQSLERFRNLSGRLDFLCQEPALNSGEKDILKKLSSDFGLHYQAPLDAAKTGFQENYFDFMSSTDVLEHIPKNDLLPILKECFRILKPGGICSLIIDYKDHYTYFDAEVSDYDFLKYSESQWKKYNNALHYQNRLRHSDYIDLILESGFKILKEETNQPDETALKTIGNLRLDGQYKKYDIHDLGITGSHLVLIK